MRKVLREALNVIRDGGGTDISVTDGGRHAFIEFTVSGERHRVPVHRGGKFMSYEASRLRSQLRRRGVTHQ